MKDTTKTGTITIATACAAVVISAALAGCAGPQWVSADGQQVTLKDRLECENQGLQASGPGMPGVWQQVRVERNCLQARGYRQVIK